MDIEGFEYWALKGFGDKVLLEMKPKMIIEYNNHIQDLLSQFLNTSIEELNLICKKLGLIHISENIDFITKNNFYFFNKKAIFKILGGENDVNEEKIFDVLSGKYFEQINLGISFDKVSL